MIAFCISSYLEHSLALEEPRSGSALDLRSDLSLTRVWIIERIAEPIYLGNVNISVWGGGIMAGTVGRRCLDKKVEP